MKKKRIDQIHRKPGNYGKSGNRDTLVLQPQHAGTEIFTGYTTSAHSTNRSTRHSNQPSFLRAGIMENKTSMMLSFVNDMAQVSTDAPSATTGALGDHLRKKALEHYR